MYVECFKFAFQCCYCVFFNYKKGPIDYKYGYAVKDPHTGDDKEAWEHRNGDSVKGMRDSKNFDFL